MSEVFKIECPECGEKFDAGSAFNAHIESAKKQQEETIKKEAENILIPQEKVKKLRGEERTITEENTKPWMKNLK